VLKEEVRNTLTTNTVFNVKGIFPHVHFCDTNLEVRWVANTVLNRNSIEWINNACDMYSKNFSVVFQEYKKEMALRKDSKYFCLDTGAVMSLHGLRDTNDVDFISIGDTEKPIVNERLESHNSQYEGYGLTIREIIENPKYHFYYKNIKSSTLSVVQSFKNYRSTISPGSLNSKKDIKDANMIEAYIKNSTESTAINEYDNSTKFALNEKLYKEAKLFTKVHFLKHDIMILTVKILKPITPNILYKILRKIYHILRRIIKSASKRKYIKERIQNTLG
jgi:hypothetical protein